MPIYKISKQNGSLPSYELKEDIIKFFNDLGGDVTKYDEGNYFVVKSKGYLPEDQMEFIKLLGLSVNVESDGQDCQQGGGGKCSCPGFPSTPEV
ncbi:MAG: hypothetical protein OEY94_05570 [Alphaproteobacteria bacterium]|nr:hypothetical protein [Alphaproteobacteria bacterium]